MTRRRPLLDLVLTVLAALLAALAVYEDRCWIAALAGWASGAGLVFALVGWRDAALARLTNNTSGTTSLEFALVVPVLLFVALLLVDLGRLAYLQTALDAYAQAYVRCAALTASPPAYVPANVCAPVALPGLPQPPSVVAALDLDLSSLVITTEAPFAPILAPALTLHARALFPVN